jgi:GT2 family glycosyltransferase
MRVAVVTPTTGAPELLPCLRSVQRQEGADLRHVLVCDGPAFSAAVEDLTAQLGRPRVPVTVYHLPANTGGDGYCGHRIYAAMPFLLDDDVIVNLDEDNWIDPDHVRSLAAVIERERLAWAYSLRTIHSKDGGRIAPDDCDSLGAWPSWRFPVAPLDAFWTTLADCLPDYACLVDTSCFAIRREVYHQVSPFWHHRFQADRYVTRHLSRLFPRFATTGRYTLHYRLGSNPLSPPVEYFLEGNRAMTARYPDGFPWARRGRL